MKLEFLYVPTTDLEGSLTAYRDGLGCTELWREGDLTAALAVPGSDVNLMLDASTPTDPPGPMFVVGSVADFHTNRPATLTVVAEPSEIPGGYLATYKDPGGSTLYVLDQSTDTAPA